MENEQAAQLRVKAVLLAQQVRRWAAEVPAKAWVVLGFFFCAALLMAVHTALTAKDASLHVRVQHSFRSAQVSLWADDDLLYSARVTGSIRKKFGLIPTDSFEGSLSQIIPVRSGQHRICLRVEPDQDTMQEDTIIGDFARHTERDLSVTARSSGLLLTWQGSGATATESSSSRGWFAGYAGSLFLTMAGSIISALTGYAIKELPSRLRPGQHPAPRADLGPQ